MHQNSISLIAVLTVILNSLLTEGLLFFPGGAAGMIFAVAIPLELPKLYNVFMSYNFESNYRVPTMATDFTKGPTLLHRVRRDGTKCVQKFEKTVGDHLSYENIWSEKMNGKLDENSRIITEECEKENTPLFEPMITRKRIYQWIEAKLELYGYQGKVCLLRVICEHRTSSFSKYNGILGDMFHIVLR